VVLPATPSRRRQDRDGATAAEITHESMLSAMDRIGATFAAER
jgi:hypothetical protein